MYMYVLMLISFTPSCQQVIPEWGGGTTYYETESSNPGGWDGPLTEKECLQKLLPVYWDSQRNLKYDKNVYV